jgi:4-hydroxy-3-methylbut-2-enyl diphosphate reductase
MKITLTRDIGFCWGVKRALDLALQNSSSSKKIYTYGPLIHNEDVVQMLKEKRIEPFEPDKIKPAPNALMVIRAHGVAPGIKEKLTKNGYQIVDATCPHVRKSQKMAQDYAHNGYQIIIVGDKKHAEVVSLVGYARCIKKPLSVIVIDTPAEIPTIINRKKIPSCLGGTGKLCILAQSTFQPQLYQEIVETLKARLSSKNELVILNTICHSPARRQKQVKELAQTVEAIVVIGDHKSANTTNLTELARSLKIPAFQVANPEELPLQALRKYQSIGITTGTSTPDALIKAVIKKLRS